MAQAITNKVIVENYKYAWLICDYTMSGSTMSYTLTYHWEGGDAQLDNGWLKVGGVYAWQNTGRLHNYVEANRYRGPFDLVIHTGTATVNGDQLVEFGITKYKNVAQYGKFQASGGSAPTGGYITYNSCTWDSVDTTSGVTGWGGLQGKIEGIVVTGSSNGAVSSVTPSNWTTYGRRVARTGTLPLSTLSHEFVITDDTTTQTFDSPISIKGLLHYKLGYYNWNDVGVSQGLDNTVRYLPPAPSQFLYTDPGGVSAKTYPVVFTGVEANNHTTYDTANLKRSIRYKIDSGAWNYVANNVTATLVAQTAFNVTLTPGQTATIEGWQTYHGMDSEVSTLEITNDNTPVALYGSVNGEAHYIVKLYGSVNGQRKEIKKLYGSADGVARKIFEPVDNPYGKVVYYTDDTYTTTATAYLERTDWQFGLVANNEDGTYSVGGVSFPAKQLKEFEYGVYTPNYTPTMFLAYATHLDTISDIPSWIKTVGENYMQHCERYNGTVIIPASVQTIGLNFMDACMSLNSPVYLLGSNTTVYPGFLNKMRDMVDTVTINSPAANFTNNFLWPSFSSIDGVSPAYTTGITIKCPDSAATQAMLAKFPNESGGLIACHRKLIAGN